WLWGFLAAGLALASLPTPAPAQAAKGDPDERKLLQKLKDPNAEVRRKAALALGQLGTPRSLAATGGLLRLVKEGNPPEKAQAAAGLKNLGPAVEKAVAGLSEALKRKDEAAARKQIKELAAAVKDAGPDAAAALPQLREALEGAIPQLRAALQGPTETAK